MTKLLDVITIGRAGVDLYGQQVGGRLEDIGSFAKYIGGSPTNIACGTARLGLRSGLIMRVGDEHMGRFIREQLVREGVDVRGVATDPERLTALVILGIRDEDSFPLIFYRENCADMALCEDDIDEGLIAETRSVLATGTHLSNPRTEAAVIRALDLARKHGARTALDIDYRPNLWGLAGHDAGQSRFVESAAVTARGQATLPLFDLIVGTEEEFHIAGGTTDTVAALRAVRGVTDATLVCKRGAAGAVAFTGAIPDSLDQGEAGPGFPIEVFNVLGAGDGFLRAGPGTGPGFAAGFAFSATVGSLSTGDSASVGGSTAGSTTGSAIAGSALVTGLASVLSSALGAGSAAFFAYIWTISSSLGQENAYFSLASLITAIIVGVCIGFLPVNWHPARMFMGDGGALMLGLLTAASAIAVTGQIDIGTMGGRSQILPAFIPVLLPLAILLLPLTDFVLAVLRRLANGSSPFAADRKHLHHRLLDMGHSHLGAVLIFAAWTAVVSIGCLAFLWQPWWVAVGIMAAGFVVCAALTAAPVARRVWHTFLRVVRERRAARAAERGRSDRERIES